MSKLDLGRLIKPSSVAVVGASEREGSIGQRTMDNIVKHSRIDGDIYLVNARRTEIAGMPSYPDVASLPDVPDVAVILVPADAVMDALRDCAQKKVPFAIVLTSGFGEVGGDGADVQSEMRELADATGMRIYGPNCPGWTNLVDQVGLTFSPAFAGDRNCGPIGIATQGGGLGRSLVQSGARGIGVAMWASLGNAVDLDVPDFIEAYVKDPRITVIAVLLEGINDGTALLRSLSAARAAGKPVVMLKVGVTEYGKAAVLSHTAALAGEAAVNSTVFAQMGVIEVHDTDELMDVAWLLSRAKPTSQARIAIFGGSGGALALAADHLERNGLELAEFAPETVAAMEEVLPSFASAKNPVDTTAATISDPTLMERTLKILVKDPNVDVVLMPTPTDYGAQSSISTAAFRLAQKSTDVPLIPVWMSDSRGVGWEDLAEGGMHFGRSLSKAMQALGRWAWLGRQQRSGDVTEPAPLLVDPGQEHSGSPMPGLLTEPSLKVWLEGSGISVPEGTVVTSADDAISATDSDELWVAKVVSVDVAHKSDLGGVKLNVRGGPDAAQAYRDVTSSVRAGAPDARIDGVLFERMADDGVDLIVGVHRDPNFGPVLTVGAGGVYVEVLNDVQRRLLPITDDMARHMVSSLKILPILRGARGESAKDIDALVALLVRVSDLACANSAQLTELDLNPVRVFDEGRGVQVLDALAVTTGACS